MGPDNLSRTGVEVAGLELVLGLLLFQLVAPLPEFFVFLGFVGGRRGGRGCSQRLAGTLSLKSLRGTLFDLGFGLVGRFLGVVPGLLGRKVLLHALNGGGLPLAQVDRGALQIGGLRFFLGLGDGKLAALLLQLFVESSQILGRIEGGHQRRRGQALGLAGVAVVDVEVGAGLAEGVPQIGQIAAAAAELG